jgi:hypothetical protein
MAFAVASESLRWPDGILPYVISDDFSDSERDTIVDAIAHWNDRTIVRLIPRIGQDDFVFIEPDVDECRSAVGRIGGRQRLCCAVGDGFNTGSVIHEIGHAFGYQHEHQRPDRDQFVTVNTDNIEEGKESNFSIRSGVVLGPYDYGSIMHYPRDGFAEGGDTIVPPDGVSIGQRERLSERDVFGICLMYGAPHFVAAFEDARREDRSVVRWAGLARWGKYCWRPLPANDDDDVHQSNPSVAIDAERTSVVVWQEGRNEGAIRARCQTVDGAERFETITVASGDRHSAPDVSMHADGRFVVAWQSRQSGDGQEIRARGFDRRGLPRFDELVVSSGAAGTPGAAAVGMDGAANFVVVWGELRDESLSVHARGFDAGGRERFSTITVATDLGDQDVFPRVGVASDGTFTVAYERRMRDVRVRGFTDAGLERFPDTTVNVNPVGAQLFADAAVTPAGRTLVVWTDDRNENTLGQLRMRVFNQDGTEAQAESTGNPRGGGDQLRPRLATDVNGNVYLVWEDDEDRNGMFQIHATGLRPDRTRFLRRVTVNTHWPGQQRRPVIASR